MSHYNRASPGTRQGHQISDQTINMADKDSSLSLRFVFVKELEESDLFYCLFNKHLPNEDGKLVPNWKATT